MTIGTQIRDKTLSRNDALNSYVFDFDYDNPAWVQVQWGSDKNRTDWKTLTLTSDYTLTKTYGGGVVKLVIDPNTLVDSYGLPFAWLNIQSVYPYQQIYSFSSNYSLGNIDMIITYQEIQIQQIWSLLSTAMANPGFWSEYGLINPPNEKNRIPKINSDDGTMHFIGSSLTDNGTGLTCEINFTVLGNAEISNNLKVDKNLSVVGTTTLNGQLSGSNATFTSNVTVGGIATIPTIIGGVIATIATINSNNINNTGTLNTGPTIISGTLNVNNTSTLLDVTARNIQAVTLTLSTDAVVGGTFRVNGQSNFNADINVNNAAIFVSGNGRDPVEDPAPWTGIVQAPRIQSLYVMDVDGYLALNDLIMWPRLETAKVGDLWCMFPPTHAAPFDIGPISLLGPAGIIHVSPDRIAKGNNPQAPFTPTLIDSDLYETVTDVIIDTKNLTINQGSLTVQNSISVMTQSLMVKNGDITIDKGDLIMYDPAATFILKSGQIKVQDYHLDFDLTSIADNTLLGLKQYLVGNQIRYYLKPLPMPTGGGGSGNIMVSLDTLAKGDGAGNVVDSSISENLTEVVVNTKSLSLPTGRMQWGGIGVKMDITSAVSGQILRLVTSTDPNYQWDILPAIDQIGGVVGVSQDYYAKGDALGGLVNADLFEDATNIHVGTKNLSVDQGNLTLAGLTATLILASGQTNIQGTGINWNLKGLQDISNYRQAWGMSQTGTGPGAVYTMEPCPLFWYETKYPVAPASPFNQISTYGDPSTAVGAVGVWNRNLMLHNSYIVFDGYFSVAGVRFYIDVMNAVSGSTVGWTVPTDPTIANNADFMLTNVTAAAGTMGDKIVFGPAGQEITMSRYDQTNNAAPWTVETRWDISQANWLTAGTAGPLVAYKLPDGTLQIIVNTPAPAAPRIVGPYVAQNNSYLTWEYYIYNWQEKKMKASLPQARIFGNMLLNCFFQGGLYYDNFVQPSYTEYISTDQVLLIDFTLNDFLYITLNANITEVQLTLPEQTGGVAVVHSMELIINSNDGYSINWPGDWYWSEGYAPRTIRKVQAIGITISVIQEADGTVSYIEASIMRTTRSGFGKSMGFTLPVKTEGVMQMTDTTGGNIKANTNLLVAGDTLGNANFNGGIVNNSYGVRFLDLTGTVAGDGILYIPINGNYSIFKYTHNDNLIAITFVISTTFNTGAYMCSCQILLVSGTATAIQPTLPLPRNVYVSSGAAWNMQAGKTMAAVFDIGAGIITTNSTFVAKNSVI